VKTTYPKNITEEIVHYQALGFSAEETREALIDKNTVTISLNTIYKHRKSAVAQEIIDELIRQQERRILKQEHDNPELSLKYSNELLKILIPTRVETYSKVEATTKNFTIIRMWQPDSTNGTTDSNPAILPVSEAKKLPQRPV